uniref:Uncharacterized protein n=1 Tax=Rhizophagus irregularis (strain DAOM 181602 / DAOM 197198 / MUCL 43194) TaxID=747089 RepID=U9T7C9_RHIID
MGSSTGNLLSHLDEAHQICLNNHNNKKYKQKTFNHILHMFRDNVKNQSDFRSSRPKHGYLRITVVWITPTFEIKDVMSEIEYIPAPHTTETIATLKLFQVRI